ncbi:MAG TPA: hypothetical protein VFB60_22975 [Ktedonobacteraceae bacterium]|nr:hypothetical protein [Ktedonobacteraceae bacterium]
MTTLRRSWLIVTCLLLTIFAVACGSNAASNTGNANTMTGNKMGAASPTATMSGNQMMGATPTTAPMATPTTTTMGNTMDTFIHVGHVMLNGRSVMVLITAKGFSIYYRMSDPAPNSTCTGACAKVWPPLMANGMMLTSSMPLPKKLSVFMTANGNQVEYDGHPLYTYVGDMAPGQFNGRGMGMVWYLAGVGL